MEEMLTWFLLGFFLLILFKLFSQERARNAARRSQGMAPLVIGGVTLGAGMLVTLAFIIPYFIKSMWEIFFPPKSVGMPIWGWIIIGFLVLIVVKYMSESRGREVVYAGP